MLQLFETYYINLKNDKTRNKDMIKTLNKTNLKYKRFDGIDIVQYKKQNINNYMNETNLFCKLFSTNKIAGCGLSHIKLNQHLDKKSKHRYALILEDDIVLIPKNKFLNYKYEINKIINYYTLTNPKWDIIKLHSFCKGLGSCAAYIVSKNGMKKISNITLNYHIDIQFNNLLNIIIHENLFHTKDIEINYKNTIENYFIDNQKIGFYLNSHAYKLFDKNIKYIHFCIINLLVILLIFSKKFKKIGHILVIINILIIIKSIY